MSINPILQLLTGQWADPETGELLGVPVRSVVIADSLEGIEGDLVARLDLGRRLPVVSDPTTHGVMGARVERALTAAGEVIPNRLRDHPHADDATVGRIRAATTDADVLIAVGSGTINDLCKYAAFQDGKPYAAFGTAPSMNGYTSANAAITLDGHKKSLPTAAPLGVFLDLAILAAAPRRMIQAGLGDSICRPTAQADWLLAHLLLGQPYRRVPFVLL